MRASCSVGVSPSGLCVRMPSRICALRPATRTMKNSSRLLAEIDRKRTRSSSGWCSLAGLFEHPAIEMQPGQFAIDETRPAAIVVTGGGSAGAAATSGRRPADVAFPQPKQQLVRDPPCGKGLEKQSISRKNGGCMTVRARTGPSVKLHRPDVKVRGTVRPPAPGSPAGAGASPPRRGAATAACAAANERSMRLAMIADERFIDCDLPVGGKLDDQRA